MFRQLSFGGGFFFTMKVDFYKSKESVIPTGRPRDAVYYLERIRDGEVQKQIEKLRSALTDPEKKLIKGKLTAVTFCGTFEKRAKATFKNGSGLAILDFDKLESIDKVNELKELLAKDEYIFSVWISPSGNGLKSLVKIPTVDSNEDYNSYYKGIYKKFLWVNEKFGDDVIDTSGQDVSRLCFESYDPEIVINHNSKIFVDFEKELVLDNTQLGVVTNIPLVDQDDIANRLMVWFKNNNKNDPNKRNNSFHKLALAFNDFGVNKITAERYILPNAQTDFKEDEILALINSAYKHTSNFGSKCFEDRKKIKAISSMVLTGKTNEQIKAAFPEVEKIEDEINVQRKEVNLEQFWYYDNEGKIKISPHKFKFYLQNKNYFKHYPVEKSKTFTFVTKEDNFVDEVSEFQIKDFVLKILLAEDNLEAFDLLAASSRAFNPSYLSMLDTAEFNIEEDSQNNSLLYYKNCAVQVFKDDYKIINYEDLNGFVWKKQVIDREFVMADHHESEFRTFLWLCASKDADKYNSLKSVLGYLMHSYKTSANNKAIIFNDENISENPNGGSGKSLIWNALSHLKKVSAIDGKTFEFTKSFPYQSVPSDTQLLVFDDVKRNFNFENLFSLITEGITLEYKGQDAIKLPVSKSPKIVITTNYTINGQGGSFDRRKFEVEMSTYFNSNHSPLDEFGHMLFDDWNKIEWARFDHFMINCLKYYLENGLVSFKFKNLESRKFINETSNEFVEWSSQEDLIKFNYRYSKSEMFNQFVEEYADFKKWLTQKRFSQWIKKYCENKGLELRTGNSNGLRWIEIVNVNAPTEDTPF